RFLLEFVLLASGFQGRCKIATIHASFGSHPGNPGSNRQLAQNDKRESKDDACRDDSSDLGKYRSDSARSKFRCLTPSSHAKIVHVGLHLATSTLRRQWRWALQERDESPSIVALE